VREVLRMWSPPLLLVRDARTPVRLPAAELRPGQRFVLSPHLVHRDPAGWVDPDRFDPDRWLPRAANGPAAGNRYRPFGWPPRACVGAALGMTQLVLVCHLASTKYRVEVTDPRQTRMALAAMAVPVPLRGRVLRR
jgi:cytochrome P450